MNGNMDYSLEGSLTTSILHDLIVQLQMAVNKLGQFYKHLQNNYQISSYKPNYKQTPHFNNGFQPNTGGLKIFLDSFGVLPGKKFYITQPLLVFFPIASLLLLFILVNKPFKGNNLKQGVLGFPTNKFVNKWQKNILHVSVGGGYYFTKKWFLFKRGCRRGFGRCYYGLKAWGIRTAIRIGMRLSIINGYVRDICNIFITIFCKLYISELFRLIFRGIPFYLMRYYRFRGINRRFKLERKRQKRRAKVKRGVIKKGGQFYGLVYGIAYKCGKKDLVMLFLGFRHTMATRGIRLFRLAGGLFGIFANGYYFMFYGYLKYKAFGLAIYKIATRLQPRAGFNYLIIFMYNPNIYHAYYVDFTDACDQLQGFGVVYFEFNKGDIYYHLEIPPFVIIPKEKEDKETMTDPSLEIMAKRELTDEELGIFPHIHLDECDSIGIDTYDGYSFVRSNLGLIEHLYFMHNTTMYDLKKALILDSF